MSLNSLKKIIVILFVCTIILTADRGSMASETVGRIEERVLKATVKIETSARTLGTGFIISRPADGGLRYFFLVTNKHLIGNYTLINGRIDSYYDFITVSVYKKDGSIQKINIPLKDKQGKINIQKVFPYPEPYIDIAIISIADDLGKVRELDHVSFDLSYLATYETLKNLYVDIGDLVFALGYPYDIYSRSNNYPIAKSGYISSKIGEEIIVKLHYEDKNKKVVSYDLKAKAILLDGTLVPGNSGGPIIMPRGRRERTKVDTHEIQFTKKSIENLVIGIQSQSIKEAGISVAFSSEYILELIDKIFKNNQKH